MHISFSKKDSLYKIFKILKKVPPYRQVTISIEKEHELFQHKWRAQQLTELINEHHIDATFIVKSSLQQDYFSSVGLPVSIKWKQWVRWYFDRIKNWFFSTKSIHRQLLAKKNVPSYLIVVSEIAVLLVIWSFFRWLVSPKATITIVPSHDIVPVVYQYWFYPAWSGMSVASELHNQITIPYQIESIPYNQEMTIDVKDITYTYEPAHGQIEFINYLSEPVSLVWWTQLTTSWGVLYTLDRWINIPWWREDRPGRIRSNVTAEEYTENWLAIWELWNITQWTELFIKKIDESIIEKKVFALAKSGFSDWKSEGKWTVIQEDIEWIEETILQSMRKNKKAHLQDQFMNHDNAILLPFDELVTFSVQEFISTATVWDSTTFVDWTVNATLNYAYISVDDFYNAVEEFIKQRPLQGKFLIDYDPHSVEFFVLRPEEEDPNYFKVPVKVNTIWWYNFLEDTYDLWKEMINNVKELSRDDAKELLLQYDEVRDVIIKLSPPWYDTLPQDPNRISIRHTIKEN